MRTFFVENFGCRATQADGAALASLLENHGLFSSETADEAELVVVNTCTVTTSADADARTAIRRVHRNNPTSRILVTGCYAQRAPAELAELPGVAWVVGNSHKAEIAEIVTAADYHGGIYVGPVFPPASLGVAGKGVTDRARPNLKIQDGCNSRCSFCIIPSVRGPSRSVPFAEVIGQVRELSLRNREIVLTGINLGRWGRDEGQGARFIDLLRRLLAETAIERIRLSSVEPMDWSDELVELMASTPRLAPHVHMPLQSGSDWILRRMRRKYRASDYENRILSVRAAMPDAAIGADVMTGFPGETEERFEESRAFIERLPFTYLHVFTYSEREGTPAAAMQDQVAVPVRRERNRILRELAEAKNREFRMRMLGRTLSAVTLEQRPYAMTGNYLRVEVADWTGPNRLINVMPAAMAPGGMREQMPLPVLR